MLACLSLFLSSSVHRLRQTVDPTHRRLLDVADDPQRASVHDIELLARAQATPEHLVFAIVDRLVGARLALSQVWEWTAAHDGIALAEVLDRCSDHETAELIELTRGEPHPAPRTA